MRKFVICLLILSLLSGMANAALPFVAADDGYADGKVNVHFFWGKGCPHCAQEKPFLQSLEEEYDYLNVHYYEVYNNKENAELFGKLAQAYGEQARGVPGTFIDDEFIVGYSDKIGQKIESKVQECRESGCINPMNKLNASIGNGAVGEAQEKKNETWELPLFGEVKFDTVSLPVLAVGLGFIDGFNPCAFFVLLFLLSLMISLRSRKKMFMVGGVFVFFSGLMYFLFMAAWLNIFLVLGNVWIITLIAGIIAVFVASVNIKDYFFFKKGISLTIPDKAKPKLFKKMRGLLKAENIWSMIFGAVVLAIAANLYELLCTFSFPMVFTRILTLNNISTISYYFYLLLYNVVYIIPLLAIVVIVTITLGAKKLSEESGEILKLLSGMMMLFLGLSLIISPDVLNNVFAAFGIILCAFIVTGIIVFVDKFKNKRKVSSVEQDESSK